MEDIIVPVAGCIMIAAIIIVPAWLRSQERRKMADTLKAAIEAGHPIPPEFTAMLAGDSRGMPSPNRDMRRGLILVAIALGLVAMGLALGSAGHGPAHGMAPMIGAAAFPGFIGLALLAMWWFNRDKA